MFTRQDYLNGKCSHSEYYSQFVTAHTLAVVKGAFGIDTLKTAFAADENLNTIPLEKWDITALRIAGVSAKMKELGDYLTKAGGVCVVKEAARQLINA